MLFLLFLAWVGCVCVCVGGGGVNNLRNNFFNTNTGAE